MDQIKEGTRRKNVISIQRHHEAPLPIQIDDPSFVGVEVMNETSAPSVLEIRDVDLLEIFVEHVDFEALVENVHHLLELFRVNLVGEIVSGEEGGERDIVVVRVVRDAGPAFEDGRSDVLTVQVGAADYPDAYDR